MTLNNYHKKKKIKTFFLYRLNISYIHLAINNFEKPNIFESIQIFM